MLPQVRIDPRSLPFPAVHAPVGANSPLACESETLRSSYSHALLILDDLVRAIVS